EVAKPNRDREGDEENQRLLYVACTRAKYQLFAPVLPSDTTLRPVSGYYRALNDRLLDIIGDIQGRDALRRLFDVRDVHASDSLDDKPDEVRALLSHWVPPADLIQHSRDQDTGDRLRDLRRRRAALVTRSYTALERGRRDDPELFKRDVETAPEDDDLQGGR